MFFLQRLAERSHRVPKQAVSPARRASGSVFQEYLNVSLPRMQLVRPILQKSEEYESAIQAVRPAGVDVSSGVEQAHGIKSVDKMKSFIEGVRGV